MTAPDNPRPKEPGAEADEAPQLHHVYFNPHGGDIYCMIPDGEGIEKHMRDFERHLERTHQPWEYHVHAGGGIHPQSHRILRDHDNPHPDTGQGLLRAVAHGPMPMLEEKNRRIEQLERQVKELTRGIDAKIAAAVAAAIKGRA